MNTAGKMNEESLPVIKEEQNTLKFNTIEGFLEVVTESTIKVEEHFQEKEKEYEEQQMKFTFDALNLILDFGIQNQICDMNDNLEVVESERKRSKKYDGEEESLHKSMKRKVDFKEEYVEYTFKKNGKDARKKSGRMDEESLPESEAKETPITSIFKSAQKMANCCIEKIIKIYRTPIFTRSRKSLTRKSLSQIRRQLNSTSFKGRQDFLDKTIGGVSDKALQGTDSKDRDFMHEFNHHMTTLLERQEIGESRKRMSVLEKEEAFETFLVKNKDKVERNSIEIIKVTNHLIDLLKENSEVGSIGSSSDDDSEQKDHISLGSKSSNQYFESPMRKDDSIFTQNSYSCEKPLKFRKDLVCSSSKAKKMGSSLLSKKKVYASTFTKKKKPKVLGSFKEQFEGLKLARNRSKMEQIRREDTFETYEMTDEDDSCEDLSPEKLRFVKRSRYLIGKFKTGYSESIDKKKVQKLLTKEKKNKTHLSQFDEEDKENDNTPIKNKIVPVCGKKRVPWWACDADFIRKNLEENEDKIRSIFTRKIGKVDLSRMFGEDVKRKSPYRGDR